jgi:flagella basal body P-ring formation protein FlgA
MPDDPETKTVTIPAKAAVPVIRTGDSVVLEESSPLIEARLEARALGPAACGAEFKARLAIGGKIVRAVALGKGRAAFVTEAGSRP